MAEWKKKEEEMRYDIFELSFNQMLKKTFISYRKKYLFIIVKFRLIIHSYPKRK